MQVWSRRVSVSSHRGSRAAHQLLFEEPQGRGVELVYNRARVLRHHMRGEGVRPPSTGQTLHDQNGPRQPRPDEFISGEEGEELLKIEKKIVKRISLPHILVELTGAETKPIIVSFSRDMENLIFFK